MRYEYNKKLKIGECIPETPLEAVEQMEGFFESDMWYAKRKEWKTEDAMVEYLKMHFKICKDAINKMEKKK